MRSEELETGFKEEQIADDVVDDYSEDEKYSDIVEDDNNQSHGKKDDSFIEEPVEDMPVDGDDDIIEDFYGV